MGGYACSIAIRSPPQTCTPPTGSLRRGESDEHRVGAAALRRGNDGHARRLGERTEPLQHLVLDVERRERLVDDALRGGTTLGPGDHDLRFLLGDLALPSH